MFEDGKIRNSTKITPLFPFCGAIPQPASAEFHYFYPANERPLIRNIAFYLLLSCLLPVAAVQAQVPSFALYQQFGGHSDFTFVGNTLNYVENEGNPPGPCTIKTSSSADLLLGPGDEIVMARLYWAGSGNGSGDNVVQLNGVDVTADSSRWLNYGNMPAFCAVADVTDLVKAQGATTYTFSGLDLNDVINTMSYCNNGVNFGGWAIAVVYENAALPINQVNLYDGLMSVPVPGQPLPSGFVITLNALNVIDAVGAKAGFIAWEGDAGLPTESFLFNNQALTNAVNPDENNAFNGTNSVTGSTTLYNMDLDIYDIQDNITPGDTQATIRLTSGQDFVMISTVLTKLNSLLPDATVSIDAVSTQCGSREFTVAYTVYNDESTDALPANVPVSVYADGVYIATVSTASVLQPGQSESGVVTVTIPDGIPDGFTLEFIADRLQNGSGTVPELSETNNSDSAEARISGIPPFNAPPLLRTCNLGLGRGVFDFGTYAGLIRVRPEDDIAFFATEAAAIAGTPEILDESAYDIIAPATVFVRITTVDGCYAITSFPLETYNCPPKVYNLVEPGSNGHFDAMQIDGLRDIFLNFKMSVYNRWGTLVWTGGHSQENFSGRANEGTTWFGQDLPGGTYFWLLNLNDPGYPEPLSGFLYLKK